MSVQASLPFDELSRVATETTAIASVLSTEFEVVPLADTVQLCISDAAEEAMESCDGVSSIDPALLILTAAHDVETKAVLAQGLSMRSQAILTQLLPDEVISDELRNDWLAAYSDKLVGDLLVALTFAFLLR